MKSLYKILPILAIMTGLFVAPAMAAPATATDFVQSLGDQALATISNKDFDKGQKQAKLTKLFNENIDFQWIGRFVLGHAWREATAEQKTRYVAEYKKFLVLHYTSRFIDYTGGTFKVSGEKDDGDGEFTVGMQLKSNDPDSEPVQVDYRVRKNPGTGFKIFDVIVEGVSLLATQRSEFASVISDKGLDYLIDQLEEKSSSGEIQEPNS